MRPARPYVHIFYVLTVSCLFCKYLAHLIRNSSVSLLLIFPPRRLHIILHNNESFFISPYLRPNCFSFPPPKILLLTAPSQPKAKAPVQKCEGRWGARRSWSAAFSLPPPSRRPCTWWNGCAGTKTSPSSSSLGPTPLVCIRSMKVSECPSIPMQHFDKFVMCSHC